MSNSNIEYGTTKSNSSDLSLPIMNSSNNNNNNNDTIAATSIDNNNNKSDEREPLAANADLIQETEDMNSPSTRNENEQQQQEEASSPTFIICCAAVGGFLFGYDTAIVNGSCYQLHKTFGFELDSWQTGLIVAMGVAGSFCGSLVGGASGDYFGRRPTIVAADVAFIIGSIVLAVAPKFWILILGRFVVGLGIGIASIIVPVYLAEITEGEIRGRAITGNNFFITGGQFIASIIAVIFITVFSHDLGWRLMFGFGAIPALIQLFLLKFLPESPRFLLMKNRPHEEVAEVVKQLSLNPDFIEETQDELRDAPEFSITDLIVDPTLRKRVFLVCMLMVFQQADGINTLMYYSADVLKHASFHNDRDPIYWSVPLAFLNAVGTIVGFWAVDKYGRRPLLLISSIGCFFSIGAFVAVGFISEKAYTSTPHASGVLYLIFLCLYICFFAPGLGPVPWCAVGEMFPTRYRAAGGAIASASNWAMNTIVSQAFPILMGTSIGMPGTFSILLGLILLSVFFFYYNVPETKNLSLEEIDQLFTHHDHHHHHDGTDHHGNQNSTSAAAAAVANEEDDDTVRLTK